MRERERERETNRKRERERERAKERERERERDRHLEYHMSYFCERVILVVRQKAVFSPRLLHVSKFVTYRSCKRVSF